MLDFSAIRNNLDKLLAEVDWLVESYKALKAKSSNGSAPVPDAVKPVDGVSADAQAAHAAAIKAKDEQIAKLTKENTAFKEQMSGSEETQLQNKLDDATNAVKHASDKISSLGLPPKKVEPPPPPPVVAPTEASAPSPTSAPVAPGPGGPASDGKPAPKPGAATAP